MYTAEIVAGPWDGSLVDLQDHHVESKRFILATGVNNETRACYRIVPGLTTSGRLRAIPCPSCAKSQPKP